VEIARKRKFKERPQNLHPYEFARNGSCKERNLQGGGGWNGLCKECICLQTDYVVSITVHWRQYLAGYTSYRAIGLVIVSCFKHIRRSTFDFNGVYRTL